MNTKSSQTSPFLELAANQNCSMSRALEVLGDVWAFLVLRELFFGIRRFGVIKQNLGIAGTTLSLRLEKLEEHQVLARHLYLEKPKRYEYRLTQKGLALYPALVSLLMWEDEWNPSETGAPLLLTHKPCGHSLKTLIVCSHCKKEVSAKDVEPREGKKYVAPPAGSKNASRLSSNTSLYLHGRTCSVARALVTIGDRWSFQILRASFFGVKRFEDFARLLTIARNVLTSRLKKLINEGIFERQQYDSKPPRFKYILTPKGLALYGSCLLLIGWGDAWENNDEGAPILLHHRHCNHLFSGELVCRQCNQLVDPREIEFNVVSNKV